eukprot:TRINITY_DN26247_c0_g1_i2.p1 TRINITY_DN26247_c0_g1~~TRINITY_DN26247_c0_g1_i2.p1  ORF type:complete len:188 (-),score=27.99 TRINITY_DN26247_c0_g1_i2:89-652(-)
MRQARACSEDLESESSGSTMREEEVWLRYDSRCVIQDCSVGFARIISGKSKLQGSTYTMRDDLKEYFKYEQEYLSFREWHESIVAKAAERNSFASGAETLQKQVMLRVRSRLVKKYKTIAVTLSIDITGANDDTFTATVISIRKERSLAGGTSRHLASASLRSTEENPDSRESEDVMSVVIGKRESL